MTNWHEAVLKTRLHGWVGRAEQVQVVALKVVPHGQVVTDGHWHWQVTWL